MNYKLVSGNLGSWILTIFSATPFIHEIGTLVGIMAGLGSLALSIVSIFWIMKQSKAMR